MKNTNGSQSVISDPAKLTFLVGMPGVGKTHWGEKVASEFGYSFTDLDLFVCQEEQASISALFAMYGENGFREREQKQLKKLIKTTKTDAVIACGGGTPCYADNMQLMKNAGTVIYLEATILLLLQHLRTSDEIRPLLNNRGDLGAYLDGLLKKRKPFYEQAHHILQTEDISIANFAKIISHA